MQSRTTYEIVGGRETFAKLAKAFYARVDKEPVLRGMYPESLERPITTLTLFLIQFFGGPAEYNEKQGQPRLKMRHARFKIGQAERDAWLTHMLAAIEEIGIQEPSKSLMAQYFKDTSAFLINQPEEKGAPDTLRPTTPGTYPLG